MFEHKKSMFRARLLWETKVLSPTIILFKKKKHSHLTILEITTIILFQNYFRFNPYMSLPEGYALDTKDVKLLEFMRRDAQLYMRRNRVKIEEAAEQLTRSNAVARGWRTLSGWVEQLNKRRQNFDSQKI